MPRNTCQTCFHDYDWTWEEAFDKFGFNDGDGQVMTGTVVDVLEDAGYEVITFGGIHNEFITSITKDGVEQIPESTDLGYEDPRYYLPKEIIDLLDTKLPETEVHA